MEGIEWNVSGEIFFCYWKYLTLTNISVIHTLLILFQATVLNVAFNSHNKALLTIMMSNNVSVINLYTYHLVLFTCILWKYRILIIRYNPSDTKPYTIYMYVMQDVLLLFLLALCIWTMIATDEWNVWMKVVIWRNTIGDV